MHPRLQTIVLAGVALGLGWLIYEARQARAAAEETSRVYLTLEREMTMSDKPSELRTPVTCESTGLTTEVVSYQKEGETAQAFVARHFELVAATRAGCPE